MRLHFAVALPASSNESKGTIKIEFLLDIQNLEVHTRSASSWGVGPLSLMIEAIDAINLHWQVLRIITSESSRGRRTRPMMFSAQSLWTALRKSNPQSSVLRLFSSTPITEAGYKMKSHSGAKKRWRSLASGSSFKRVR